MKSWNRILMRLMPFILLAGGILFIVMGISTFSKKTNYTETTAVITDMVDRSYYDGENHVEAYDVEVEFLVDGKPVKAMLDEYHSGYAVGKEVKIKYNPNDPTDIVAAGGLVVVLQFGLGIVAIIGGLVMLIRGRRY